MKNQNGCFVLFFIMCFIFAVIANKSKADNKNTEVEKVNTYVVPNKEVVNQNMQNTRWVYTESKDEMTSKMQYFATCYSNQKVQFSKPYEGGSIVKLNVRNMGRGNELILRVDKGRFLINKKSTLDIKFDNEKPLTVSYNGSIDKSLDVIFLNNSNKLIAKLKKAKKVLIEVPFFRQGNIIIDFDVEGLVWNK